MKKRLIPTFVLIAYGLILIKVMVFKDIPLIRVGSLMLNFGGTDGGHPANFVPFKTIVPYLLGYKGLIIAGINLIGNIALLVPVGLIVPFVFRNITWKKSLILAVLSGFIIEIMQVVLRVGIFDIDDVILNALGVMIGYCSYVVLIKWIRSRSYKNIVIATIIFIASIVAVFYVVYPKGQSSMNPRNGEVVVLKGTDPCGGTGGLGKIIDQKKGSITVERGDGVHETIYITDKTTIKNSEGPVAESNLKIGDRVTVVVYEDKIATAVLVCGVINSETRTAQ